MIDEISAFYYRQKVIMKRRPGELSWILVHPFIGLLSIGILALFVVKNGAPQNSVMFVFVGVIMWNFYDLVQRGITFGITFDIWGTTMKHSFSAKASPMHFIIGNSLFGFTSAVIAFVLVGIVGLFAFGFNIFAAGFFLINLLPVCLFAVAIGLMINSLMVSKGERYTALIWVLTGIVMIFSGVYYPVSVLPSPIFEIAHALPSTYAINSMRAAFGYSPELLIPDLIIGFVLSIVYLVAGYFIFVYGLKKGYTNGTITKY